MASSGTSELPEEALLKLPRIARYDTMAELDRMMVGRLPITDCAAEIHPVLEKA